MKRLGGLLAFLFVWLCAAPAIGQTNVGLNCFNSSVAPPWTPCSSTNPLYVTVASGSGTQDVNLKQVGGATISLGQALMAASIPVAFASNQSTLTVTGAGGTFPATQSTSPWVVAGGGTAGTAATGVVTVQGIASMTPLLTTQQPTAGALTSTSITVTNSSGTFLAASTASKYLTCKNESASASIALNFANGTAVLNTAGNITLPPGASITFDGTAVPTGAITGISSAASSPATCLSS